MHNDFKSPGVDDNFSPSCFPGGNLLFSPKTPTLSFLHFFLFVNKKQNRILEVLWILISGVLPWWGGLAQKRADFYWNIVYINMESEPQNLLFVFLQKKKL